MRRLGDKAGVEYGVLRRSENGHILWAAIYGTRQDAVDNATPMDSVEERDVGPWRQLRQD